jgi:hypothetical protein
VSIVFWGKVLADFGVEGGERRGLSVRREEGGLDILKEVEEDGDASLLIGGVGTLVIFSINHIKT